ncbi:MAG: prepilin-type N-terminal cleavage/methylation domain-containing protein [Gammaproteobacteria bacterium]
MLKILNQQPSAQSSAQNGFSMLEIMVVIAIIGILAAMVAPSYRQHVVKTKLDNIFKSTMGAQEQITSEYIRTGALSGIFLNTGKYNIAGQSNIALNPTTGALTITTNSSYLNGEIVSLLLTPTIQVDGTLRWVCTAISGNAAVIPSQCR